MVELAGFAVLVPVLVSWGKIFGLVKDGQSQEWATGLNLLAGVVALGFRLAGYADQLPGLDASAGLVAQALAQALVFIGQMGISTFSYSKLRGTFLGYTFSSICVS
jgi:hypothetical protein